MKPTYALHERVTAEGAHMHRHFIYYCRALNELSSAVDKFWQHS